MNTLKPFFVELTYNAVVMATNETDAEVKADQMAHRITSDDCYPRTEATEIRSLAQLRRLDHNWDASCCAYGGDEPSLGNVLPEEDPPERDTSTIDMFGGQP